MYFGVSEKVKIPRIFKNSLENYFGEKRELKL